MSIDFLLLWFRFFRVTQKPRKAYRMAVVESRKPVPF
jgi:hypothetical protein